MTDALEVLWPWLELPGAVIPGRVIARWPSATRDTLLELGILQSAEPAESILCPECEEHEETLVTRLMPTGELRWLISCPQVARLEVAAEWVQQWSVHWTKLQMLLRQAMSLHGTSVELVRDVVWRLGRWDGPQARHDLLLVRVGSLPESEWLPVVEQANHPLVLLIGNFQNMEHGFPALLLREVVALAGNRLVLDQSALTACVTPALAKPNPIQNSFQLRGDFWELTYAGHTQYLKDRVGMTYLARLLSEPQRDLPAVSLLAARAGIDPLVTTGSLGTMLDPTARAAYAERYQELRTELQEAQDDHDLGRLESLQVELEQLTSELARVTGLGGKSRQQSDVERVRKSVSMAVARDLERILDVHPELGKHLTKTITSGVIFRYAPEPIIDWLT